MLYNRDKHMVVLSKKGVMKNSEGNGFLSRLGLYLAQGLLIIGGWLMLFNHLGFFSDEVYFLSYSMVNLWIVFIGILLNFGFVPYLYFSSLLKYKRNDNFWDVETSWILALFFSGLFFQYGVKQLYLVNILLLIVLTTFVVHARFMIASRRVSNLNVDVPGKYVYFETLKYLAAYYIIVIALLVTFNPFNLLHAWF